MMHLCYGILHSVGSGSTPTEFKTCLPEIVDLMLESGKFNELYCKFMSSKENQGHSSKLVCRCWGRRNIFLDTGQGFPQFSHVPDISVLYKGV